MSTIGSLACAVAAVGVVAYGATRVLGQWIDRDLRRRYLWARLLITSAPLAVGLAVALVPGAVLGLAGGLAEEPLPELGGGALALLGLSAGTLATQIHRLVRARLGALPLHSEEQQDAADEPAPYRGQVGQ